MFSSKFIDFLPQFRIHGLLYLNNLYQISNVIHIGSQKSYSCDHAGQVLSPLYEDCVKLLDALKLNNEVNIDEKFASIRNTRRRAAGETVS